MNEILRSLQEGSFVLDLGSGAGSFEASLTRAVVVRIDNDVRCSDNAVRGDAGRLPFADAAFDAVIANHTFEHFEDLPAALREVRRVAKPDGALFVSVPDASTLCDRIYRWLARGGGHVNAFVSAQDLSELIADATGLRHLATRTLHTSLSYLNRRNARSRLPLRLWLLGGGYEWTLFLFAWMSKKLDRAFGTRSGVYGWAFYFGNVPGPIDTTGWVNVCLRCGAGSASAQLMPLRGFAVPARYGCPACGAINPYASDR